MASCFAPVSISGGSHLKARELSSAKSATLGKAPKLIVQRKANQLETNSNKFSVRAERREGSQGGSGDFIAGFFIGGAVFGTLAYIFAPQIRRSILNEDEYGFRRAKRPIYYDDGLERTRQTLNAKISQLNNAIDNVSSRLRGGSSSPTVPLETDSELEATM